ncbi:MAG: type II toxin-antitoxin system RelE/ParE family toxin [Bryobacteraceae bacterium]
MSRYTLAPAAAKDLAEIWLYIRNQATEEMANRVEATIRAKLGMLARMPGLGHRRSDITFRNVRFFRVYFYLIVYLDGRKPLQVVAILHGARDLRPILSNRT